MILQVLQIVSPVLLCRSIDKKTKKLLEGQNERSEFEGCTETCKVFLKKKF